MVYMKNSFELIDKLLTDSFDHILAIEELCLRSGDLVDITIKELHTIVAIGMNEPKAMNEIAKELSITLGTLTVAVNSLVKKGYVERYRIDSDKRVVKVGLIKKGRFAFRMHDKFHRDMIIALLSGLSEEEELVLSTSLGKLNDFLKEKHEMVKKPRISGKQEESNVF